MSGFWPWEVPLPDSSSARVYAADLDAVLAEAKSDISRCVSPEEQERARRFRSSLDRDRFLASRFLLRLVLAKSTGRSPNELTFRTNRFGKLQLNGNGLQFNLSHSANYFALGISLDAKVGIDTESRMTKQTASEVAPRILSDAEFARWQSADPAIRPYLLTRYWTLKEAVLKAQGTGFSEDPRTIVVDLSGDQASLCQVPKGFAGLPHWRLLELQPDGPFPTIALALIF